MAFNPSILSAATNVVSADTGSINEFVNSNNDSYLVHLLEFNDDIHDIDTSRKINFYKNLNDSIIAESCGKDLAIYNEGIVSNIVAKLVEIITRIIRFIGDVAKKIFGISGNNRAKYDSGVKETKSAIRDHNSNANANKNLWQNDPTSKKVINVYHFPDVEKIDSQQFRACLNNIISELERVCSNNYQSGKASEKSEQMAFKVLGKLVSKYVEHRNGSYDISSIKDEKSFMDYVRSELCYTEQVEMDLNGFMKEIDILDAKIHSAAPFQKKIKEFEQDLNRAKNIVKNAVFNTKEQEQHANALVAQIQSVVRAYTSMLVTINKYEAAAVKYYIAIGDKYIVGKTVTESGFIHGEKFDSDTLFDNEDYRDFNRTEWIDLNITTECYEIKFEMVECAKRIAIQEALIFADNQYNKFGRIMAMREAEETKTGANVKAILERIKKFLETFIQNIRNRYSKNAKILRRNMKFVEKPITIRDIKSSGDILAGMYRIQQKLNILPFNYSTMKDDLKDKETFFKNKILPNLRNTSQYTKRDVKWTDGMSIADYCRAYYGASMSEEKYPKCAFTGKDIEANKSNIVRFLQTENIFSAKSDLQTLENESKKVYSKMQTNTPAASNDQKPEGNAEQKPAEGSTNESYYSELYGMWFTEAEIEMGEKPEGQQQSNSSANSEEATAFRIYMEVYKDVILAKMTASEFIVSELMQIMMAHINSHMSPEQKKAEADIQSKENPKTSK